MNYLDYWKLSDKPFEGNRDSRFFYHSKCHEEALERLLYICRDGNMNFGLLTGEIGCGKTMTRTVIENKLEKEGFQVVCIENSNLPYRDILIEIVSQIKKERPGQSYVTEYQIITALKELIVKVVIEGGKRLIIIMDEAQQLEKDCIDKVKNLTNISSESENYITIILIGQPDLKNTILSMPQISQRIALRYHIRPFDLSDTDNYIIHRLKTAGHPTGYLFNDDAVDLLYLHTGGIPRSINRFCKLALDFGFSRQRDMIDKTVIEAIIRDFNMQEASSVTLLKTEQPAKKTPVSIDDKAAQPSGIFECPWCQKKYRINITNPQSPAIVKCLYCNNISIFKIFRGREIILKYDGRK
ncbi:MAG: AAA family ATPase [Nitrospinae bacterium]|nr:AAA family ATPase [Nitrospinota bacterium]